MGAALASFAGLTATRTFATVRSGETPALLERAWAALDRHSAAVVNRDVMAIADFSIQSGLPRLQLLDIGNGRVMSTHLVAHGRGSDPANSGWVERFSNQPGSNASCPGAFLTSSTYIGKHGTQRRLIGLDPENNNALNRGIVIHAASYVDNDLAETIGRVGRSQGCFAVSNADLAGVLARLGPGRLLFAGR